MSADDYFEAGYEHSRDWIGHWRFSHEADHADCCHYRWCGHWRVRHEAYYDVQPCDRTGYWGDCRPAGHEHRGCAVLGEDVEWYSLRVLCAAHVYEAGFDDDEHADNHDADERADGHSADRGAYAGLCACVQRDAFRVPSDDDYEVGCGYQHGNERAGHWRFQAGCGCEHGCDRAGHWRF